VIQGIVTPDDEATISLQVQDSQGQLVTVSAVVDTGFNGALTLPASNIRTLALQLHGTRDALLADGSSLRLDVYRGTVIWDGSPRAIQVLAAEGGPLVGMRLMRGCELRIEVLDGGTVTITALPGRP
jgi:clan AA aspartic protease